jgi:hypothetical protein
MILGRSWITHLSTFGVFYLAFLLMILTILVYYPGYMSPDSVVMLGMARAGVTTNVYSPLMSYIWRVTDWLLPGPGGMLIFQNVIYWLALAMIAYSANCNWLLGILFVLSGLWIPTFAMLGTIWKDVGMQGFLLMAVAATLYGRRSGRIWPFVLAVLSLFLACGYRQNGIVAVAPMLVAVFYCVSHHVRLPRKLTEHRLVPALYTAVAGAILVAFLGGLWLLDSYKLQDAKLWSVAMVHDLAAISVFQNANYLPAYINRDNALTVEDLKHMYSPLHANSLFIPESRKVLEVLDPSPDKVVKYTLSDKEARELQFYWFTTVLDHFGSYLRHRLLMTERLLVLRPRQPWYPYIVGIDPNPFGLKFHRSRLNHYATRLTQFAAFSTRLYSAWMYYAVVTVCLFLSFFWRFEHALLVQCLGISVWLYYLSIFMFGMSGDFRYNIWALSCAPLCMFLLLCGHAKVSKPYSSPLV